MAKIRTAGLWSVVCLASAVALAAGENPVIVGNPAIVLEPHATSGSIAVDLRNDTAQAVMLHLSVWPTQPAGQSAAVAIKGQGADAGSFDLSMKPHSAERIWVTLSAADAEDFDIDLLNGTERIGKIPVKHKGFAVHLSEPKTVLNLRHGKPVDIRIINDGPTSHYLSWRLRIGGDDVCRGEVNVGPKSPALLECIPNFESWTFMNRFGTLVRPVPSPDATLIVHKADGAATQAPLSMATLPVSAQFFDDSIQWANYAVVLVFLLLGALASLVLSAVIPNRLSRITLEERLQELNRTIGGMGPHTDSGLRVRLRVEGSRLEAVLLSRAYYSPEFASVITQCSDGIERLQRRLVLTKQLEFVLRRLADAEATTRISWTHADQARTNTSRAEELLRKDAPSDTDFGIIEKAIADATEALQSTRSADPTFQDDLKNRVSVLKTLLPDPELEQAFKRIDDQAPQPRRTINTLTPVNAATATALDRAAKKLELILAYFHHWTGVPDGIKKNRMLHAEKRFLELLQNSNVATIYEAERVLQQIRDDVYPDDLITLLRDRAARIVVNASEVYARVPLQFNVMFEEPRNERAAAARGELQCYWHFEDGQSEQGWDVTHYYHGRRCTWIQKIVGGFRKVSISSWMGTRGMHAECGREVFRVRATFTDMHGKPVTILNDKPAAVQNTEYDYSKASVGLTTESHTKLPVAPCAESKGKVLVELITGITVHSLGDSKHFGGRTVVELFKLCAALLVAVFALVAGARDQIDKLDVLPGLIAIFLIGYGADTIKSLLSSKK